MLLCTLSMARDAATEEGIMRNHRNAGLTPLPLVAGRRVTWLPLAGADAWYSTCYSEAHEAAVPVEIAPGYAEIHGVAVAVRGPGGVEHGVPLSRSDAEELLRHLRGGHPIRNSLRQTAGVH
jgi:hypothetical protein